MVFASIFVGTRDMDVLRDGVLENRVLVGLVARTQEIVTRITDSIIEASG